MGDVPPEKISTLTPTDMNWESSNKNEVHPHGVATNNVVFCAEYLISGTRYTQAAAVRGVEHKLALERLAT
jgi:hypothetical protein